MRVGTTNNNSHKGVLVDRVEFLSSVEKLRAWLLVYAPRLKLHSGYAKEIHTVYPSWESIFEPEESAEQQVVAALGYLDTSDSWWYDLTAEMHAALLFRDRLEGEFDQVDPEDGKAVIALICEVVFVGQLYLLCLSVIAKAEQARRACVPATELQQHWLTLVQELNAKFFFTSGNG